MPGLFDDVLGPARAPVPAAAPPPAPAQRLGGRGLFDDVLTAPAATNVGATLGGLAGPVVPQEVPLDAAGLPDYSGVFKSDPGVGELLLRGYASGGERFIGLANLLGMAPAALVDLVRGDSVATDKLGAEVDLAFGNVNRMALDPAREDVGLGSELLHGVAGFAPDLAATIATGGEYGAARAAIAPMVEQNLARSVMRELERNAVTGARAAAIPGATRGGEVAVQATQAGADPLTAGAAGASAGLGTALTNLLPVSASGNLAVRMGQGAAANPVADLAQTELENAALPDALGLDRAMDGSDLALSALFGAPMAGALGERGHQAGAFGAPAPAPAPAPVATPGAPAPDSGPLGALLGEILGGAPDATPPPARADGSSGLFDDVLQPSAPAADPPAGTRQPAATQQGTPPAADLPASDRVEKPEPPRLEARGREVELRTPAGSPLKARYALVDAGALTASNDTGGAVNPAYPQELQPRERERKASQAQIAAIAGSLDPLLLGDSPTTADGAPIVGADGVVESGNGRTLAIRQAYAGGKAEAYRQWLTDNAQRFGLDPAEVATHPAPMLVRVRGDAVTPADRARLARESNESTVARMGAAERAKQDATLLTDEDLALYRPNEDGSVLGAGNQEFLNRFVRALPESERGELMTGDGRWSAEMARRVQAALFARAYRDPDVVNLQAEEASPDVRNILTGLNRAAPAFAALGEDGAPLRQAVVDAVRKVRDAKRGGQALDEALRQSDLLGGDTPAADRIAAFFGANARSGARIGDFLEELAGITAANDDRGTVGGGLFGDAPAGGAVLDGALDQATRKRASKRDDAAPEYPLAPPGSRYQETELEPTMMAPYEFLRRARPLELDDASRDNIADLKAAMQAGRKMDPLHLYADGKEDGRHRAYAALELGMTQVPVIVHGRDAARKLRSQLGLFAGPTAREQVDAAAKAKDAQRDGLGRDEVPPSRGPGDLFAGPRPTQAKLPEAKSQAPAAVAEPAAVRTELERAIGAAAVAKLERAGLLKFTATDGTTTQAEWDGQAIDLREGAIPKGHAWAVLLHETAHAKLEEILGAEGWAKAQADYQRLLAAGDATARAAEARVRKAEVAPEDLAQERLAYLIEEAAKRHPAPGVIGLIQRVLSAFRRWAATSKLFKALGADAPTLKPADFVAYARQGLARLEADAARRIDRDGIDRSLPDAPARYFEAGEFSVPIDRLDSSKPDREGEGALRRFRQAAKGEIPRRGALTVRRGSDGRYTVLDGNGSLAAARTQGWKELPVRMATWRDELKLAAAPADTKATLREMFRDAERALPEFRDQLETLAEELGLPDPKVAPLKGVPRALEKVAADYGGDASRLKDLVRGTVVVDHAGQVPAVIDALRAAFGDQVTVKRDSLSSDAPATPDGYRDALVYVRVDGVLAEVQVNAPEMLAAKDGPGHALYEKARSIEGRALQDGRELSAEEMTQLRALREQMAEVYGRAWESMQSRRNSASDSTVARKNEAGGNGRDSARSQARQMAPPDGVGSKVTGTSSKSPNSVPAGKASGSRMADSPGSSRGSVPRSRSSVRAEDVAARTRTGELPLPPVPAEEQPSVEARSWRQKIREAFERKWEPLGNLPERDLYLDLRGLAAGRIAKSEALAEAIVAKLANIPKADREAVHAYLTTAGATPEAIADLGVRMAAQDAKLLIHKVGDALVERGLIPAESREKYRDAYLPRLYFAHLLKGDAWRTFGTGRGLSDQGYRKARNDEIPAEVRKVALGEVTDPAFLAAVAIAKPARDLALVDWLAQVGGKTAWTLPEATVEWNGKRVTPYWLKDRADQLRQQARLYEDPASAAHARMLAEELDGLADQALTAIGAVPATVRAEFKQVPDSARYGPMRGLWTRKEIYEDIVGLARLVPEDRNFAERALGFGGWSTSAVGMWKWAKVAANPPSQIRNAVSNAVMLNMSGVPMHRIPDLLARAVGEIRKDGPAYQAAKAHGATGGTFANEELKRLHTDLLDVAKREGQLGTLGQVNLMARRFVNAVGDVYQATETVFKVAKVMHGLELGQTPAAAAREAQKWLFDYSLVPQSVRYLRNAPIGAPFLTYSYKVLPRLLEVALEHPTRLLPFIGLMYGWSYALAALLDVSEEEIDKLEEALPEWMRDRSGVMMLPLRDAEGRWTFIDTGYYLPWTMWWDMARHAAKGDVNKAREDMGLISGPIVDVLVAMTTGRDNFTGQEIAKPGDPPAEQWKDRLAWVWGLVAPPMLDVRHGALGRSMQAAEGELDRDGNPAVTPVQAALRYVGVNIYPTDLESSRDRNVRRLVMEIQDTMQRARQELRKAPPAQREAVSEKYRTELERRQGKLREYRENTTIPEKLR